MNGLRLFFLYLFLLAGLYGEAHTQLPKPVEVQYADSSNTDSLVPFQSCPDCLIGLSRADSTIVIPPQFDSLKTLIADSYHLRPFPKKVFYVVGKEGKFGVLNPEGTVVVPILYQHIEVLCSSDPGDQPNLILLLRPDSTSCQLANLRAGIISDQRFDWNYGNKPYLLRPRPYTMKEVSFACHAEDRWLILDSLFRQEVELPYDPIQYLGPDLIKVQRLRRGYVECGVVNQHGEEIVPFDRGYLTTVISWQGKPAFWRKTKKGATEIFDYAGQLRWKGQMNMTDWGPVPQEDGYEFPQPHQELAPLILVKDEAGKEGGIDPFGDVVIPFEFDEIYDIRRRYDPHNWNDWAGVFTRKNGQCGLFMLDGSPNIPIRYDVLKPLFYCGTWSNRFLEGRDSAGISIFDGINNELLVAGVDTVFEHNTDSYPHLRESNCFDRFYYPFLIKEGHLYQLRSDGVQLMDGCLLQSSQPVNRIGGISVDPKGRIVDLPDYLRSTPISP